MRRERSLEWGVPPSRKRGAACRSRSLPATSHGYPPLHYQSLSLPETDFIFACPQGGSPMPFTSVSHTSISPEAPYRYWDNSQSPVLSRWTPLSSDELPPLRLSSASPPPDLSQLEVCLLFPYGDRRFRFGDR